ncbi:hypothetical protein [Pararhodobacter marinus]|nr:hypothetical protein [Pararhodobacter marinus]
MRAIVHIGAPKAGSTAIQSNIRDNRQELSDQGFFCYWPSRGPNDRALSERFEAAKGPRPPQVQHAFEKIPDPVSWSNACWRELAEQVARSDHDFAIISSEHFFNTPDPNGLLDALSGIFDDLTLVVYLRDPVEQYNSHLNQLIRGGARFRNLKTPVAYQYYAYSHLPAMLEKIGSEKVVARNFSRKHLKNGDVADDFFDVVSSIADRPVSVSQKAARVNESLCGAATVWLMAQNESFSVQAPKHLELRRQVIRRLREDLALKDLPPLKLEDPAMAAILRWNAREACQWYNDTLLGSDSLLALETAAPDVPDYREAREQMRAWMFSYLSQDALEKVLRAAVPVTG